MCQAWTTSLYDREVVGQATALAAGWGNLGGAMTQVGREGGREEGREGGQRKGAKKFGVSEWYRGWVGGREGGWEGRRQKLTKHACLPPFLPSSLSLSPRL